MYDPRRQGSPVMTELTEPSFEEIRKYSWEEKKGGASQSWPKRQVDDLLCATVK